MVTSVVEDGPTVSARDDPGGGRPPAGHPGGGAAGRSLSNAVPVVVLAATVAAVLATWALTRSVVRDQERRLLTQRADVVRALLANAFDNLQSSLRVLGHVGASSDPAAAELFGASARTLIGPATGTVAVGVAVDHGTGFVVTNAVGDGPTSRLLTGDRASLAARAAGVGKTGTLLLHEGSRVRVVIAVPVAPGAVAFQESVFDPSVPVPSTPGSPFRELRVALYAADRPDPARLLITTEARLPLQGRMAHLPFLVGTDEWLLAVSAREPLTGTFADRVPLMLLGGGLILALLAGLVARVLVDRRSFALALVARRTGELAETRTALDRMLTAGPMLVMRVETAHGRATYVSPNVERLYGLAPEDTATPGFLTERVHPDDADLFRSVLERVAAGRASHETIEFRFRRGDGAYRWTAGVFVADDVAGDRSEGAEAVLVYALDVDDRHRADEARREAQESAEAANLAKSQFLSRMSHELRTPLNAVLGFGQLLELQPITEEQREFIGYIVQGGRHLLDLINEVLDISRIEAGELSLSPEPVQASAVIGEAVDLMRPMADQHGIQVLVDRSDGWDCYLYADRQRIKQILLNLVSNAIKYNRSRGTVAVACGPAGDTRAAVRVTDTGPGIPAEHLARLFTPFDRLGAENTTVEGTGIGLALSKRLAEAMDGRLTAASTLGRGSTFTLELPVVEGPVERLDRLHPADEPEPEPGAGRRTVLHIEDNLANVHLVERILARRPEVEVVAAMQGSLGLELAREHQPALVLLDLHLPDMSGEQVLHRLRQDGATASVPVVMVSADATTGQAQRLLAAGATAYLTKPVDVAALLRAVDDALGR